MLLFVVCTSLQNLLVLRLAGNRLRLIREKAFYQLAKLEQLDLSRNLFEQQLVDYTFYGLNALQKLDVSNNSLDSIGSDNLIGLGTAPLNTFNCSFNKLSHVASDAFTGMTLSELNANLFISEVRSKE